MKITITRPVDVDVKYLFASMHVRYWEDATVNDIRETDEAPTIPLRNGDMWDIMIDIEQGRIMNWPVGNTASTYYKVCDEGTYTLTSYDMEGVVIRKSGYVPSMLCPKEDGYGDYVIMDIDENGYIDGWKFDHTYFTTVDD